MFSSYHLLFVIYRNHICLIYNLHNLKQSTNHQRLYIFYNTISYSLYIEINISFIYNLHNLKRSLKLSITGQHNRLFKTITLNKRIT